MQARPGRNCADGCRSVIFVFNDGVMLLLVRLGHVYVGCHFLTFENMSWYLVQVVKLECEKGRCQSILLPHSH